MTNTPHRKTSGYVKTTVHAEKILRILIPLVIILLVISLLFFYLKTAHSEVVKPSNVIFRLLDSVFFPTPTPEPTGSANPTGNPDEVTPSGQPNPLFPENGSIDFMNSNKSTETLFDELDTQVDELEKAHIDTALVEKLRLNALAEREKGNDEEARKKALWILQLTRELLELQKEVEGS